MKKLKKLPAVSIEGDWNATKEHCGCGYKAVWKVQLNGGDDDITVTEQPGAACCGGVPNCFLKTHKMKKVNEGEWKGTLGFKPIKLSKRSEGKLYHVTTDGPMIMVR